MNKKSLKMSLKAPQDSLQLERHLESPRSSTIRIPLNLTGVKSCKLTEFDENIKMPLVFLPKSSNKDPWKNIASDILRSIHSEYSFAKKSDFGTKIERPKPIIIENEKLSARDPLSSRMSRTSKMDESVFIRFSPQAEKKTSFVFGEELKKKQARRIANTSIKNGDGPNQIPKLTHPVSFDELGSEISEINDLLPSTDENGDFHPRDLRRKSCEGPGFGEPTSFQLKVNTLFPIKFQTRISVKKLEFHKGLIQFEREKMKTLTSITRMKKIRSPAKKENLTVLLMKNQSKTTANQISNLINSSIKSNNIRRSLAVNPLEENKLEQFELLSARKKEKEVFTIEEEEDRENQLEGAVLEKKASLNEDDVIVASQREKISKEALTTLENSEKPLIIFDNNNKADRSEDSSSLLPTRRVTCEIPKKKSVQGENSAEIYFLRRTKTFCREKTPKFPAIPKKNTSESIIIDLHKNIELVYGQISPEKIQAKMNLNSPSEKTRTSANSKMRFFTLEPTFHDIEPQTKRGNISQYHDTQRSEEKREVKTGIDEYKKIMKENTPKYQIFTKHYPDKLYNSPNNPMSNIYKSKNLVNVVREIRTKIESLGGRTKSNQKYKDESPNTPRLKIKAMAKVFSVEDLYGMGHRKLKSTNS